MIRFQGNYSDFYKISIPNTHEKVGYLYLIYFDNGRLKIGLSKNIISRIKQHQNSYNGYTGGSSKTICILGPFLDCVSAEKELLQIFIDNGYPLVALDEWFIADESSIDLHKKLTSELTVISPRKSFKPTFPPEFKKEMTHFEEYLALYKENKNADQD